MGGEEEEGEFEVQNYSPDVWAETPDAVVGLGSCISTVPLLLGGDGIRHRRWV